MSNIKKFEVLVTVNAKKTEVLGMHDGALKVALHAKPVDGEANKELLKALSAHFKIPKSKIEVVKGLASRRKTVTIATL